MRKDFDFDDEREEKAKIIVTIIPFVLIIIILAVTLLVSSSNNSEPEQENEALQESIKEYADNNLLGEKENEELATATPEEENAETSPTKEKPGVTSSKEPSPTPYKEIMEAGKKDYSKIEFETEDQLKEMMAYWVDTNQKALDDLAALDHFKAMSFSLRGTKECYYYGDKNSSGLPHGMGIAVYADNQYYYGGWENGVRSGNGTWIHYHIHETPSKTDLYTCHQYTGSWKNDLPNGEGSEHYDYNMELLKENTGYDVNLIGSYKDGLADGEFYITNIYSDGEVLEWYADAKNGSWIYINENVDTKGRRPVHVEDRNDENYIWLHPNNNNNIGVSCLISKNKN